MQVISERVDEVDGPITSCIILEVPRKQHKGNVPHILPCEGIRSSQFLRGFCMGEKDLRSRLTAPPSFLELLHEDLPNHNVIIILEDGTEDDGDTVLVGRDVPGREYKMEGGCKEMVS